MRITDGPVVIEFPAASHRPVPLDGWECAVYEVAPDGHEEALKNVSRVDICAEPGSVVWARVRVEQAYDHFGIRAKDMYCDVLEVRVREDRDQRRLALSLRDRLRAGVVRARRLTRRLLLRLLAADRR
jgi:hypothetical protein